MEHDARGTALRDILVARFDAPDPTRGRRRRTAVAAVAAFALAGAGTGGAVAAWATTNEHLPDTGATGAAALLTNDLVEMSIGRDASPIGEPIVIAGDGTTTVSLAPPEGATGLAISIACMGYGEVTLIVDGSAGQALVCETGGATAIGSGWPTVPTSDRMTFESTGKFAAQYVWITSNESRMSAATRDALADGVITADEYDAAFNRFASCMESAGYPLGAIDKSINHYDFSISTTAVDLGIYGRCYSTEFMEIDVWWQINTPKY